MQTVIRSYLRGKKGLHELAIVEKNGVFWIESKSLAGRKSLCQETDDLVSLYQPFSKKLKALLKVNIEECRVDLRSDSGNLALPIGV